MTLIFVPAMASAKPSWRSTAGATAGLGAYGASGTLTGLANPLVHVKPGGTLLLEIGSTQAESAAGLFSAKTGVQEDLSHHPRVLTVEP